MLTRGEWSGYWQHLWDADNRAAAMTNTTTGNWVWFAYDGDGRRVKKVDNGITTTVYVGALFELNVTAEVTSTYYFANGKRIAVRSGTGLYYLHSDNLGSHSASTSVTGTLTARIGYKPYGLTAWSTAELPAQFGYTGQRYDQGDGYLYDYGARFYDEYIGRFISADTIVPGAGNPQALNRYSYVAGNPLKYIDPSGHDLIIVPGIETDDWINQPERWQEWIMKYMGWDDRQWQTFVRKYKDNREETMAEYGIYFFDWSKCSCPGPTGQSSTSAQVDDWGLKELSRMVAGKSNITFLAHSKGANLVLNFLQQLPAYLPPGQETPRNAVLMNFPTRGLMYLAVGVKPTDRSLGPSSVNVVNLYNTEDPFNHLDQGEVRGAANYRYTYSSPWGEDYFARDYRVLNDAAIVRDIFSLYFRVNQEPFIP